MSNIAIFHRWFIFCLVGFNCRLKLCRVASDLHRTDITSAKITICKASPLRPSRKYGVPKRFFAYRVVFCSSSSSGSTQVEQLRQNCLLTNRQKRSKIDVQTCKRVWRDPAPTRNDNRGFSQLTAIPDARDKVGHHRGTKSDNEPLTRARGWSRPSGQSYFSHKRNRFAFFCFSARFISSSRKKHDKRKVHPHEKNRSNNGK